MLRLALHLLLILTLTALSQLGGLAWLIALLFRHRLLAFALAYAALWAGAMVAAPLFGREALPCFGAPLRSQSVLYCALNRTYVTPELQAVAYDLALDMDARFPGTVTLTLDAGFPFGPLPLLPHLSHRDGQKLDLAFWYKDANGLYLPRQTRSPIGYFAFEDGPTECPSAGPTLRWDLAWLQPAFPDWELEPERTRYAVEHLAADPRVGRMFLEPYLVARLGLLSPKLRFQGCRAARHDDHLHLELAAP
jgi:hypothetical protein